MKYTISTTIVSSAYMYVFITSFDTRHLQLKNAEKTENDKMTDF